MYLFIVNCVITVRIPVAVKLISVVEQVDTCNVVYRSMLYGSLDEQI